MNSLRYHFCWSDDIAGTERALEAEIPVLLVLMDVDELDARTEYVWRVRQLSISRMSRIQGKSLFRRPVSLNQ